MDTPINKLPKPIIKPKSDAKSDAKQAPKKRVKKVKHIDQLYDHKFLANYQN
jgi:hypothetical protein